jgi:ADP-ribose pyrophosphatase
MKRVTSEAPIHEGFLPISLVRVSDGIQVDTRLSFYEVLRRPISVGVLAVEENGQAMLVSQFRPAINKYILEIPAGRVNPDEGPFDAAIREFREETGYRPNTIKSIGRFWLSPGYSDEMIYLYYATDLVPDGLPQDEHEDVVVEKVDVWNYEAIDAKTMLALSWFRNTRPSAYVCRSDTHP